VRVTKIRRRVLTQAVFIRVMAASIQRPRGQVCASVMGETPRSATGATAKRRICRCREFHIQS
jgi:hypothetical protein